LFSGNQPPDDADPIALAYAGHQFGGFVPQLGDGRAILLGERVGRDGVRRDIQLKGSGRTPFSRNGDGRAALGPMLREYLISEAMHALGIPTTRSLAVVTTGEQVVREDLQPGAVLTRVAASHIRVGTFEYFAARNDRVSEQVARRRRKPPAPDFSPITPLITRWGGIALGNGGCVAGRDRVARNIVSLPPIALGRVLCVLLLPKPRRNRVVVFELLFLLDDLEHRVDLVERQTRNAAQLRSQVTHGRSRYAFDTSFTCTRPSE
jgi:hypothetical protein